MSKYILQTATRYYGMKGYPVIYVGGQFCVAQSGFSKRVCVFKSREGAETVRRSFYRPSDFIVREVAK